MNHVKCAYLYGAPRCSTGDTIVIAIIRFTDAAVSTASNSTSDARILTLLLPWTKRICCRRTTRRDRPFWVAKSCDCIGNWLLHLWNHGRQKS